MTPRHLQHPSGPAPVPAEQSIPQPKQQLNSLEPQIGRHAREVRRPNHRARNLRDRRVLQPHREGRDAHCPIRDLGRLTEVQADAEDRQQHCLDRDGKDVLGCAPAAPRRLGHDRRRDCAAQEAEPDKCEQQQLAGVKRSRCAPISVTVPVTLPAKLPQATNATTLQNPAIQLSEMARRAF